MIRVRSLAAFSAVLGAVCAAASAPAPAAAPKHLWYRFVVAATVGRTVVSETDPPAGEPSTSSVKRLTVEWVAGSETATTMSLQPNGDVSLTAGMAGRVKAYKETNDEDTFYRTPNPKDLSAKPLVVPCKNNTATEMKEQPAVHFTGLLFGSAAEGIRLRVYSKLPRATIERTRSTTCSEHPTKPTKFEGYDDVLLFPPEYRAMRLHRSVVDFTNGFTAREKRVFAGDVFHPGPYESERTTWTFNVKVTFYRCPGTNACSNGSIPPDAYLPPGS